MSVTPIWNPTRLQTCKGNEYFVDWCVSSHIEQSVLHSTLVTLDLSCMEVRALGPARLDWATIGRGCFLQKSHPGNSGFTHRVWATLRKKKNKDARLKKILFVHLTKFRRKEKKKKKIHVEKHLAPGLNSNRKWKSLESSFVVEQKPWKDEFKEWMLDQQNRWNSLVPLVKFKFKFFGKSFLFLTFDFYSR